jgi:hypothetical protein
LQTQNRKVKKLPRYVEEVTTGKVIRVYDHHFSPYVLCLTRHSRLSRDDFRQKLSEGSFRPVNRDNSFCRVSAAKLL